jgi:hypothetical protein
MQVLAYAALQSVQCRDERLGHIPATEGSEPALGVRELAGDGVGQQTLAVGV